MKNLIDTERFSLEMRSRIIKIEEKKIFISNLLGSNEALDKFTIINCQGYGRVREFQNYSLHLDKYSKKNKTRPLLRGFPATQKLKTQVFQVGACNWRCWYCFVDFDLLSGNSQKGKFYSTDELIEMYLLETDRAVVIDLSGGQPDLVPEWTLWMMNSIEKYGLKHKVYVWIDDNLSNEYLWKFLSKREIKYMSTFPLSSRIGCFKGFDSNSFSFNTSASSEGFEKQFKIFEKFLKSEFNMYAYATFTTDNNKELRQKIVKFTDLLQEVHPNLPLRTIPLKITRFHANIARITSSHEKSIKFQFEAIEYWVEELAKRFSMSQLESPYSEIPLNF